MEDTDDIVDPSYYESNIANTHLPAIQRSQKEKKSISTRFASIMENTNAWLFKKGIRMKHLPTSSSDEEDVEVPMGKRSKSRTNNKKDPEESIPISSPKPKGKAPKYKFTVKCPKGG